MMFIEWFAAATGIIGALLLAANIKQSPYGFVLFFLSSVAWSYCSYMTEQTPLLFNQLVFVVINIIGVKRWLLNGSKNNHNDILPMPNKI